MHRMDAELATRIDSVELLGYQVGPIELAAHWKNDSLQFDPIDAPLENGRIRLQPSVRLVNDLPVLTLAAGRVLDKVAIDRKLCDLILRYVDPLFAISENLRGQLSLEIDRLDVPLSLDGLFRGSLEGRLILDEVEFSPDESLRDLLASAGLSLDSSVRTSQTVSIRLEDGRVYHTGFALPVGDDRVTLDGWVGLDHSLNIRVSLPVTEQMVLKEKRLYRMLRGQRIEVPITGTLEHPNVHEDILTHNVQRLIQIALRDGLSGNEPVRGLLRKALK